MTTSFTHLDLSFYYEQIYTYTKPTAFNIPTELDAMARSLGIKRHQGEALPDYALRLRRLQAMGHQTYDLGGIQFHFSNEMEEEPSSLVIECIDTSVIPHSYISNHQLVVRSVKRDSTVAGTYDLFSASSFPSLEHLAAKIGVDNTSYFAYVNPYLETKRNLPVLGLLDGQHNLERKNYLAPTATSFHLPDTSIMFGSLDGNYLLDTWVEKTSSAEVTAQRTYHLDYYSGKVTSYEVFPDGAVLNYEVAERLPRYTAVPSPVVNLCNDDVLNRYGTEFSAQRNLYYISSDSASTSSSPAPGVSFPPDLVDAIQVANNFIFDRWGE